MENGRRSEVSHYERLLQTASTIKAFSGDTFREYQQKKALLVSEQNRAMLGQADLASMTGTGGIAMMENNHYNHAQFIESLLFQYDGRVLVDTVIWVSQTYRNHGFSIDYFAKSLDSWVVVLKENVTDQTFQEVYPIYQWLIAELPNYSQINLFADKQAKNEKI